MKIDWSSPETHVLFNPRQPATEARDFQRLIHERPGITGHVWMATSGSTARAPGMLKWVALSKEALLESARAVNGHLASDSSDVWIHALPIFHVGGLGIHARAFLSGARVAPGMDEGRGRWEPRLFHRLCAREGGTLSALVPTQLYDLVELGLRAPPTMRATLVGGGALAEPLRLKARLLGWNPLPSYGSTECCSQVATAGLEDPDGKLRVLPHFEVATDRSGRLVFRGKALLSGYAVVDRGTLRWIDPRDSQGGFVSEDLGRVLDGVLVLFGRTSDRIKVGGETVDLSRLSRIAEEIRVELQAAPGNDASSDVERERDVAFFPVPDSRLGEVIHVAFAASDPHAEAWASRFLNALEGRLLPFERPRRAHFMRRIPRSPLGKLLRAELLRDIEGSALARPIR